MIQILKHISICFLSVIALNLSAQDLHFSQYFNNPILINPANTGFAPDVDWRAGLNYRNQWANTGVPYKTMSVWGDVQLFNETFENAWVGVGGLILRDVSGSGNLTSTKIFGSIAYHQMVGFNTLVSAGFNVGWAAKRVDPSKLTFDDQWNGRFFDANIPSTENFAFSQIGFPTLQAGINVAYFPTDNIYLNAGFSAMNINRPREAFLQPGTIDDRVDRRYTAFANGAIKIDDLWIINPNIYVSKQGTAWETVAGVNANRNLSGDGSSQLILGAYYRLGDAIIPMFGYQLNDYKITINYDATISTLRAFNNTRGAYELSIVKQGLFNGEKSIKCPTLRF